MVSRGEGTLRREKNIMIGNPTDWKSKLKGGTKFESLQSNVEHNGYCNQLAIPRFDT